MNVTRNKRNNGMGVALGALALAGVVISAWVTHVVWAVNALAGEQSPTTGKMVLGVIGTLMPPIGTIHGFIIWFS